MSINNSYLWLEEAENRKRKQENRKQETRKQEEKKHEIGKQEKVDEHKQFISLA